MGPTPQSMAVLKSSKFKCQACQVGFNSKKALEKHRKTQEHKATEKAFLQDRDAKRRNEAARGVFYFPVPTDGNEILKLQSPINTVTLFKQSTID